jgi:cell division transport system permease protein
MRVRTVASEAVIGLRRNLVMSVAAIVTIAVSLAFVGTALLVTRTVGDIRKIFYTQIEISIFLDEDVTQPQRDEVDRTLSTLPLVQSVTYESKAEAYRRFKLQFQDQPDLLANVTQDALPESYRVKLRDPTQYDVVASAVKGLPGVGQVVDYRKFLDDLFAILDGLRNAAIATAVVQLVAAILLIGNTVRVAAFSRRRETGVMRLVGATRLYIQLPFLIEGVVAGLVGAGAAIGLLFAGKALVLDRTLRPLFRSGVIPSISDHDILVESWKLVVIGVVISGIASLVTLQRYIRV